MKNQNISVIIPAFNEEKNIGKELEKLGKMSFKEIIVIDDGSSDNTASIVSKIARKSKNIKFLQNKTNKGKGASMRIGAKTASGDILVFVDADGQFNVSEIPKLVDGLKNSDMVIGARNIIAIPPQRRITNKLTRFALFLGTGKKIKDAISGFRTIRRKDFLALNLKRNRYEIESEIIYKVLKRNMRISYFPVTVRYSGASKLTFKQGLIISLFLFKVIFRRVK